MKRIHGVLLIITGIVHTICAVLPGIFGKQYVEFSKKGFFSISNGVLSFPLLNGIMDYEVFAAFWFFYAGHLLIVCGLLFDYIEKLQNCIPLYLSISLTTVVIIGSYMIPLSGMTFLLIPQCVYMLIRSLKNYNHIRGQKHE